MTSNFTDADKRRIASQLSAVVEYMADGKWHTLQSISTNLEKQHGRFFPHGSIGSQIRNARLRGHTIHKRRVNVSSGLYEYQLIAKEDSNTKAA